MRWRIIQNIHPILEELCTRNCFKSKKNMWDYRLKNVHVPYFSQLMVVNGHSSKLWQQWGTGMQNISEAKWNAVLNVRNMYKRRLIPYCVILFNIAYIHITQLPGLQTWDDKSKRKHIPVWQESGHFFILHQIRLCLLSSLTNERCISCLCVPGIFIPTFSVLSQNPARVVLIEDQSSLDLSYATALIEE